MKKDPITTAIETLTAQRDAHLASAAKILRALDVLEEYRPAAEQAEPDEPAPAPKSLGHAMREAVRAKRGVRPKPPEVKVTGRCDVCGKPATATVGCSRGCGKVARGCAEHSGKALGGRIAGHVRGCDGTAGQARHKPAKAATPAEEEPVAQPADEVATKRAARAEAIAAKLRAGVAEKRKAAEAPRPPVVKDPNRDPRVFRCQGRIPVESTGTRAQGTTTCGALVFGNKRGEHARTVHGVAGVEYVLVESEEAAS